MAKDDYFVLAYRILKYLYACQKSGERPDAQAFSPNALGICSSYWLYLMEHLSAAAYVSGIHVNLHTARIGNVQITPNGIEYLMENGMMERAAAFLRGQAAVLGV